MRAGRTPHNDNARLPAGTVDNTKQLGCADDNATPHWQQGVPRQLVARVLDYRHSHPLEPLPAALQRELGRRWLAFARRQR